MPEFNIKTNCRINELLEEKQLILVRLINHMASMPWDYQSNVADRLKAISHENPWQDKIPGFDKELFLKNHPIEEDEDSTYDPAYDAASYT